MSTASVAESIGAGAVLGYDLDAELAWACRFLDAELAKELCSAEVVLCCPIPLSTASVLARSSEAFAPQDHCLGVISLGLRGVSSSINR